MRGQYFFEIGLGHAIYRGFAMRVGIVGAPVAIENGYVAKPNPWLHVGQGNLFARYRDRADPHRPLGAGNPFFGRLAPRTDQVAVFESFDIGAS